MEGGGEGKRDLKAPSLTMPLAITLYMYELVDIITIKYETHQSRCSSTDKREKYRGMANFGQKTNHPCHINVHM